MSHAHYQGRPAGAVFDLDGVITDTARAHFQAWKALFDDYLPDQRPFSSEDYLQYVDGLPRYDGVRQYLSSRGVVLADGDPSDSPEQDTVCGLGNRKNQKFHQVLERDGVTVFPSSIALIRRLREQGVAVGVASSSKNCQSVLVRADIEGLFAARVDGTVLAELGLPGKPDPAMFVHCAERLGVDPAQSLVVEDALAGVQAGHDGGFGLTVGIARQDSGAALLQHGADLVVSDLSELTEEIIHDWFQHR